MPEFRRRAVLPLMVALAFAAVAAGGDVPADFAPRLPIARPVPQPAPDGPTVDAGRGPVPVIVPSSYDAGTPTPLVIALHGYTNTGPEVEAYFRLAPRAEEYGFLYLFPTGTDDLFGNPFWNATDACCNFFGSGVDDSGYLRALVEVMGAEYNVDPRRVYFVGHSNGGFMSYRMACDHADTVAAIASLAGATWLDPADCAPAGPVDTLQIHGTSDGVISYNGGCSFGNCYPGAVATTEQWAAFNGCSPVGEPGDETYDIDGGIPGAETTVLRYDTGCEPGGSSQLWTIPGGPHSPALTPEFGRLVVEFLLAHPRPSDCPEDLDGSGAVDFADLLTILGTWGPCPPKGSCPADLDGSGAVDFGDLLRVLGAWGGC